MGREERNLSLSKVWLEEPDPHPPTKAQASFYILFYQCSTHHTVGWGSAHGSSPHQMRDGNSPAPRQQHLPASTLPLTLCQAQCKLTSSLWPFLRHSLPTGNRSTQTAVGEKAALAHICILYSTVFKVLFELISYKLFLKPLGRI